MDNLTRNQKLVLDVLQGSGRQMSAYEILDQLRPEGLKAPLQVYRALDKLVGGHLVHKVESLNAFVSCNHQSSHKSGDMTVFTICQDCGDVSEFNADAVADVLLKQADKTGFKAFQAAVEIKGTCARCI